MFKTNLAVALRNFRHNKVFSAINIIGLAIGISASLVIYLIVQYDLSFDKFEADGNRIYRIVSDYKFSGDEIHNSGVPDPLADAVKNEMTGIDVVAPFHEPNFQVKVSIGTRSASQSKRFNDQQHIIFTDQNYFKLLPHRWLVGTPASALKDAFQIVLSEARAKIYFPKMPLTELVGKTVTYNDSIHLTVSGVVEDLSENTDFLFSEFVSQATIKTTGLKDNYSWAEWGSTSSSSQLFIKVARGNSVAHIEQQLALLMKKYNKDQKHDSRNDAAFRLQPLRDLHFNSNYGNFSEHLAHMPTLYGLLIVGLFLLLLGCVNFINLATAQASQRAKEIGIRKTMGSSKGQLIVQFLSETFLVTLFATILSALLTPLLLKVFEDFIPKGLHFSLLQHPGVFVFLLVLLIAVTLLSGLYPSMVLSKYNPALVLKNQSAANSGKTRKLWIRKTLTLSQFMIAQVFIMATIIVSKQIHFTLTKDMGFRKDAIIYFSADYYDSHKQNKNILIEKLKSLPGISMVSLSNSPPSSGNTNTSTMKYKDGKKEIETDVQIKMADTSYINLFGLKMLAGHNIPPSDTVNALVINETYAHVLGFRHPEDAISKLISWDNKQLPIVGVISDFNQHSLHESVKPLVIASRGSNEYTINVLLQPQDASGTAWKSTIAKIGVLWKNIYPETDFNYEFYDESIAKYYKSEQDIARLLKWATGLAIFISALGLLGLVMYTTNQRRKEIGVRKVLGASVAHIVAILSKDFIALVFFAFLVATPIAWWATDKWLQNFAYKTSVSWWVFLLSGLLMTIVALVTLSIQTIRAASVNPVKSLRTE